MTKTLYEDALAAGRPPYHVITSIEVRLAPIDMGYDPRIRDEPVELPADLTIASLEIDGEVYVVEGSHEELIAAIRAAGYTIAE